MNAKRRHRMKGLGVLRLCLLLAAGAAALFAFAPRAQACSWCSCETTLMQPTKDHETAQHDKIRDETIPEEFRELERWLLNDVWLKYFPELLVNITHELTVMALYQLQMIGAMMDATNQMETQRLFQELNARAYKDYRPSPRLCSFATGVRSLAAAEQRSKVSIAAMNRWAQARHLGNTNAGSAEGAGNDKSNRLFLFRSRFCDVYDNNGLKNVMAAGGRSGLSPLCAGGGAAPATVPVESRNKDIDYLRTVNAAKTLNVDFTDNTLWSDETDLFALASNLYDHNVSIRIPESQFESASDEEAVLDVRSIVAKRSVAEESLFTIAGMKSPGSESDVFCANGFTGCSTGTLGYMAVILKDLGIEPDDVIAKYGIRPSYYAQMEILTKKIYQNQDFYTDLYDTPANVARKAATLQAIGLMQDFDTLESHLRTEMMLSVILELEIMKLQETVKKKIVAAISTNG